MTGLRYVHKPVVVQAMQVPPRWDGKGTPMALVALANWLGTRDPWALCSDGSVEIKEPSLNPGFPNVITVQPGDWIIKDATGGFHFSDDATFSERYEALV